MDSSLGASIELLDNPLDVLETVAALNSWDFERLNDNEMTFRRDNNNVMYDVIVSWSPNLEAIQLAVSYDFSPNTTNLNELYKLLAEVNNECFFGHFDYWKNENKIVYRATQMLVDDNDLTKAFCLDMTDHAIQILEKYLSVFKSVLLYDMETKHALKLADFNTLGNA